ncbi:unnamed protein product [Closterium sp. NIES-53]
MYPQLSELLPRCRCHRWPFFRCLHAAAAAAAAAAAVAAAADAVVGSVDQPQAEALAVPPPTPHPTNHPQFPAHPPPSPHSSPCPHSPPSAPLPCPNSAPYLRPLMRPPSPPYSPSQSPAPTPHHSHHPNQHPQHPLLHSQHLKHSSLPEEASYDDAQGVAEETADTGPGVEAGVESTGGSPDRCDWLESQWWKRKRRRKRALARGSNWGEETTDRATSAPESESGTAPEIDFFCNVATSPSAFPSPPPHSVPSPAPLPPAPAVPSDTSTAAFSGDPPLPPSAPSATTATSAIPFFFRRPSPLLRSFPRSLIIPPMPVTLIRILVENRCSKLLEGPGSDVVLLEGKSQAPGSGTLILPSLTTSAASHCVGFFCVVAAIRTEPSSA